MLCKLTTVYGVVIINNMKAKQLLNQRLILSETAFAEMVVWDVPAPVAGSEHSFKYRLAYVVAGECVLRFDNEIGKGDHFHVSDEAFDYEFMTVDQLLSDFWTQCG